MNEDAVLLDATRSGVAVVTLNRPHLDNAMNPDIIERLTDICEDMKGADGVRCVILDGAGEAFSAGDDASWARFEADYTREDHLEDSKALAHLLHMWRGLPMLTIALVHGAAVGTGFALTAASDIAIADRSAFFICPDVRNGSVPAVLAPFIVEVIGDRAARRFLLTGERIDADEALRLGLVHAVVSDRQGLSAAAETLAQAIFEAAPEAVAATKAVIDIVDRTPIDAQLLSEMSRRMADSLVEPEGREGLAALLAGRKPNWMV